MKSDKSLSFLVNMGIILFLITAGQIIGSTTDLPVEEKYVPPAEPQVQENLKTWQDMKFGLLMHWGPYSQWGVVESWSICSEDRAWTKRNIENYEEYKRRYQELPKTFNPVRFAPEKWARAAKQAGMKYVVFTTKHHDGFSMFDTKLTDYRITAENCPFHVHPQADVTKAIFEAFRSEGLWTGAYFSKPDWHSEYYWWPNFATPDRHVNYDPAKYPERWRKFQDFTYGQLEELMTGYGRVDILWLDGGWVRPRKNIPDEIRNWGLKDNYNQDIDMARIAAMARRHQPGLIIVDRTVTGPYENYTTPEQRIPDKALDYPWESCITMAEGWSYAPHHTYKSVHTLVHMLVDIVAKGGNFLLNIGPAPDGTWDNQAYDRLQGMGGWLEINGEAIYGSNPLAPFKEGKVCLTRGKDGTVYVIYMADEDETAPPSKIWLSSYQPGEGAELSLLGKKGVLSWENVGKGFVVDIPESARKNPPCRYAWTVKISQR